MDKNEHRMLSAFDTPSPLQNSIGFVFSMETLNCKLEPELSNWLYEIMLYSLGQPHGNWDSCPFVASGPSLYIGYGKTFLRPHTFEAMYISRSC